MTTRAIRVSEVIRRELSWCFQREVELEGLVLTISAVETSADLKEASIFISLFDASIPDENLLMILNRHRNEWQQWIGKRLQSKFTPRLTFKIDNSLDRGDRVLRIIEELDKETKTDS
ncbi:ribosome-binding factor A [Methylacidiphilum kamchatkense Kam1]|uniref:Ribosome-binding factor A n=1 Tax=Methylacidiphilum kamchatkense Kam1 TaxID=1202785 RepID=A0A0C1UR05_9BACT|nr:30S ribosome-binding factor RbfA [Methylacidiphilum kamchatkense]KIE58749.1 ribosome-binding factor A [Methylacidiphilum kamchatkense Kam1]QDQ41853.1 ribosome-binding factor A [Methylacidiphilum kamchatkense Kam1]